MILTMTVQTPAAAYYFLPQDIKSPKYLIKYNKMNSLLEWVVYISMIYFCIFS